MFRLNLFTMSWRPTASGRRTQTYGQVWMPDVARLTFQPYATNGHWAVTEYGNTWVSDYDWGWAPFHYGRWQFDDYYGRWIWVPDTQWGPAWVSWRSGGGYYGWAPLGPGMSINVNINLPFNYWTFVPQMYFTSPRVYSYCIPRAQYGNVYRTAPRLSTMCTATTTGRTGTGPVGMRSNATPASAYRFIAPTTLNRRGTLRRARRKQ
jgi:hypothetical protein